MGIFALTAAERRCVDQRYRQVSTAVLCSASAGVSERRLCQHKNEGHSIIKNVMLGSSLHPVPGRARTWSLAVCAVPAPQQRSQLP